MEKSRFKNSQRNDIENFNLNREIDIGYGNTNDKINKEYLNDRDIFNKFSNGNDIIDYSDIKHNEFTYGMPIFNGQIQNNKKSLISSPYIIENNNKDSFISSIMALDSNDIYEEIKTKNDSPYENNFEQNKNYNKYNDDILNSMAYNSYTINGSIGKEEINLDYTCKVEKDIADFEFELNLNKSKDFIVDINSPFALGYLWKSLVLLTKNPTTEKILTLLGIKKKDNLISDMKYNSEVFGDSGELELIIPTGNNIINNNFISKIENIYKIKINPISESYETKAILNMKYIFNLDIPLYYQPKIINKYLLGYKDSKIKFLELINVPISLQVDHEKNYAIIEIPCASNMILGFVYDVSRQHVKTLPYKKMLENKIPDVVVNKLIIPKINRNKKSAYGKKFNKELENIHFGELAYGTMYKLDINVIMGLELNISNTISKDKYEIKRNIEIIEINHRCYYYIKNKNIENKILSNGMINYI